ncbi:MAG TPA: fatty acid desaturase [Microthrixaceae bacterium]|nr:fatty acid desaturase [Microthrixaceae bacterium]
MTSVLDPTSRSALPTRADVRAAIPDDCFERRTGRSLAYLAGSLALVVGMAVAAVAWIPMTWAWLPAWIVYAIANGTAATGLWVIAHECGHGAFSANARLQDAVGFTLHSALLVPYFSWQRSHSVHHARTNHLDEGETHVPKRADHPRAVAEQRFRATVGQRTGAALAITKTLLLGWPAYLVAGVSGSDRRGRSNHFWPIRPFAGELFPPRWHRRVWVSTAGVAAVVALLVAAAVAFGPLAVVAAYVGPYVVVNAWLVGYTWLQHTDVDVPHYADDEWSWLLGAFQTIDRPYGRLVDALHHRIGSTHVAHHIDHRIPHYHAARATEAIAAAFPAWYRFDPTPVPVALWRVGRECVAVDRTEDGWSFRP